MQEMPGEVEVRGAERDRANGLLPHAAAESFKLKATPTPSTIGNSA
ncbi:hypothetical protein [Oscillatoria sp. FACHB-1406]|nr:hypothetical protein [Oscillatoria sp. FACHB-1406]MBD2580352.1 hypothetical protein [Oscillatoria sp. FACHB-1406]